MAAILKLAVHTLSEFHAGKFVRDGFISSIFGLASIHRWTKQSPKHTLFSVPA